MKQKKINGITILLAIIFVVLLIYSLSMVFIMLWGLLTTFKSHTDFNGTITGIPNVLWLPDAKYSAEQMKFANYEVIFSKLVLEKTEIFYSGTQKIYHHSKTDFWGMLFNTLLFTGIGSLLLALVPCLMAYVCAKYDYFYSKVIHTVVLFVMVIPIIGNTASEITVLRQLNLYDNWFGYFVQRFNFVGMYFLVFFAYFKGLSNTYVEAAEIDGAGQYRILWSIILPLSMKMIGSVVLIQFVQLWNNYQVPLLYLPTHPTLAYAVYDLSYANTHRDLSNVPVRIAGCMFLAIPLLILFICFQKKLMGNISMGGLKE